MNKFKVNNGNRYCKVCKYKLKKKGFTTAGKQRWFCKKCNKSFIKNRTDITNKKYLKVFLNYFLYGIKYNIPKRTFDYKVNFCWNLKINKPNNLTLNDSKIIIIDGVKVGSKTCLIIRNLSYVLYWSYVPYESSVYWMNILSKIPKSKVVVSDGQKGIKKAIKLLYNGTVYQQRCHFHILLNMKQKLSLNPKTQAGIELKDLVYELLKIKTQLQAKYWMRKLAIWYYEYVDLLKEKTPNPNYYYGSNKSKNWYTHRGLRSIYFSLYKLCFKEKSLFRYLSNTTLNIPNTTNYVEGGINSPIKNLIRNHRGLNQKRKELLVDLYLNNRTENSMKFT
jgi:hypothetical protein